MSAFVGFYRFQIIPDLRVPAIVTGIISCSGGIVTRSTGTKGAGVQDVAAGFIEGDQAHGRPVGVAIDGTGALLIADDAGNTVWRVAAAEGSITPEPTGTDRSAAAASEAGEEAAQQPASDTPEPATDEPSPPPEASPSPSDADSSSAAPQTEIAPAVQPPEGVGEDE